MKRFIFSLVLGLALASIGPAQESHKASSGASHGPGLYRPDQLQWKPGPPSLPPGAKVAVLEGDPGQKGPFTIRLLFPDGYTIPPHTHPAVEHITVMSGTFNLGMGDKFDKSATQAMPVGAFSHMPAGMKHYAWAQGETIVQLHGVGPWKIDYVNPADDPRKQK